MLTPVEQLLFVFLALLAVGATIHGFNEMYLIINRGTGSLRLNKLPARLWKALTVYITQKTTLKTRRLSSLLHLGIVWGFTYYFLVNVVDVLYGFIPNFETTLKSFGILYDLFRFGADTLSIAVLAGVAYFLARRFFLPNKTELQYHDNVLLHPRVKDGAISVDSLIVGIFILSHVGARFFR